MWSTARFDNDSFNNFLHVGTLCVIFVEKRRSLNESIDLGTKFGKGLYKFYSYHYFTFRWTISKLSTKLYTPQNLESAQILIGVLKTLTARRYKVSIWSAQYTIWVQWYIHLVNADWSSSNYLQLPSDNV